MKKILFISALGLVGCGTNRTYIQHSDVAIVSSDGKEIYIADTLHGPMIYNCWVNDCYGDSTTAHLLPPHSIEWKKVRKKSVPCNCSSGATTKSVTKT